ncbi:hypothetical protein K501DRAFT_282586 [Backusella circina FSU 941]|nr:hypothetical protein K501DRAFT_282586 [Backusella circina FSU 941]
MSFLRNFIVLSLLISFVSARFFNPEVFFSSKYTQKNWEVQECGSPDDILYLKYINITPDIIHGGEEITLEASGFLSEDVVPGAYAHVVVKLGVVTLIKKRFDICDELYKHKDDVKLQCPITKGDHTIVQKIQLPKETPRAAFSVHVMAYNADDTDLTCLNIKVDFRKK